MKIPLCLICLAATVVLGWLLFDAIQARDWFLVVLFAVTGAVCLFIGVGVYGNKILKDD